MKQGKHTQDMLSLSNNMTYTNIMKGSQSVSAARAGEKTLMFDKVNQTELFFHNNGK